MIDTATVRARVGRDGPGVWSWTLHDNGGALVTGQTPSWGSALHEALDELRLLAEADQPPAFEIPIKRLVAEALDRMPTPVPPPASPPPAFRPAWKRWLGL